MIICHEAILHYNMSFKTIAGRSDGVFWWFPALSEDQEKTLLNSPKLSCGFNNKIVVTIVHYLWTLYSVCAGTNSLHSSCVCLTQTVWGGRRIWSGVWDLRKHATGDHFPLRRGLSDVRLGPCRWSQRRLLCFQWLCTMPYPRLHCWWGLWRGKKSKASVYETVKFEFIPIDVEWYVKLVKENMTFVVFCSYFSLVVKIEKLWFVKKIVSYFHVHNQSDAKQMTIAFLTFCKVLMKLQCEILLFCALCQVNGGIRC